MGGAIAVHVAKQLPSLSGLIVIDVVEGSALDALAGMQKFLRSRPATFKSIKVCNLRVAFHMVLC